MRYTDRRVTKLQQYEPRRRPVSQLLQNEPRQRRVTQLLQNEPRQRPIVPRVSGLPLAYASARGPDEPPIADHVLYNWNKDIAEFFVVPWRTGEVIGCLKSTGQPVTIRLINYQEVDRPKLKRGSEVHRKETMFVYRRSNLEMPLETLFWGGFTFTGQFQVLRRLLIEEIVRCVAEARVVQWNFELKPENFDLLDTGRVQVARSSKRTVGPPRHVVDDITKMMALWVLPEETGQLRREVAEIAEDDAAQGEARPFPQPPQGTYSSALGTPTLGLLVQQLYALLEREWRVILATPPVRSQLP